MLTAPIKMKTLEVKMERLQADRSNICGITPAGIWSCCVRYAMVTMNVKRSDSETDIKPMIEVTINPIAGPRTATLGSTDETEVSVSRGGA